MADIFNATFDARDPRSLAHFWSRVTGLAISFESDGFVRLGAGEHGTGPHLLFLRVDRPTPGKNRLHLDLSAEDAPAEAERLLALGARAIDPPTPEGALTWREESGLSWVVLADPEDNVFCLGSHPTG